HWAGRQACDLTAPGTGPRRPVERVTAAAKARDLSHRQFLLSFPLAAPPGHEVSRTSAPICDIGGRNHCPDTPRARTQALMVLAVLFAAVLFTLQVADGHPAVH